MEQRNFTYSLKNIPLPSKDAYKKKLIEKTESVVKRMRWKALFFDQKSNANNETTPTNENESGYKLKSRKCPPTKN